jgi:hypothetical protein
MDMEEVEEILKPKRKKSVNCKHKGNRYENKLRDVLRLRFGTDYFSRSVGSGNRHGQVAALPQHAKDTYTGDLVCPENFKFAIEVKGGYDDVDLWTAVTNGHAQIDKFIAQAAEESKESHRKPIIFWQKSRKAWLAIIRTVDLPHLDWTSRLIYGEWSMLAADKLLELPDEFFMEKHVPISYAPKMKVIRNYKSA